MAKVLLVDDERYILQFWTEELTDEGHDVVSVDSGYYLLEIIDFHQPEVVVLDIRLSEWDGLDLLVDIRNHFNNLPVILCTAYDSYSEDYRAVGADFYIIKSFDLKVEYFESVVATGVLSVEA